MKKVLNKYRYTSMHGVKSLLMGLAVALLLASCSAEGDDPGREYAPNMYHSVPYDQLKQITDPDAGRWLTSIEYKDGHAEFYNSNNLNPFRMNMRMPPANTVKRNPYGWLPYRLGKDSLDIAARTLKNPLDTTEAILSQGKILYDSYCEHCHGPKGKGDGLVAEGAEVDGKKKGNYNGVANLTSDALKGISEGHIFHVITHGKGLMWPHGSQIEPADRWKIAKYVKTLQK
jgi:mono/diheme cytochrome c family protein